MAALTDLEKAFLRRRMSSGGATVNWTKPQVNDALQAIEDYIETTAKPGISAAIETAAPGVFSAAEKKLLVARYLKQKAPKDGA